MIRSEQTNLKHIEMIELYGDGILYECAVMKKDPQGNISFFEINKLDAVDKRRLTRIVTNQNADRMELWDLMAQITLNNGVNALAYFHQLVKVISPNGRIYSPKAGIVGTNGQQQKLVSSAQITDEVDVRMEIVEQKQEEVAKKTGGRRSKGAVAI